MKIISITYDDYANYQYNNSLALKAVGLNIETYKLIPSPVGYEGESKVVRKPDMQKMSCDILQIMHTRNEMISYMPQAKRYFVYHTGSRYRQAKEVFDSIFNPFCERTFVDIPDLYNDKAKNCTLFPSPIAVPDKIVHRSAGRKLIVGHFHPKAQLKGSPLIIKAMEKIEGIEFRYSDKLVSNKENLKRMAECDIIIDLLNNYQNGVPYGAWGVTTLEAAAMGKIVLSSNMFDEVYEKFYDYCPIGKIDTEADLIKYINFYAQMTTMEFRAAQDVFYEWVRDKHSFKASGEKFKQYL